MLVTTRPAQRPNALVYFGGNAEDVSFNLPQQPPSPTTPSARCTTEVTEVVPANLRNHASGADALALFDQIRTEHPNIVVVGRSLGSNVASSLGQSAARCPTGPCHFDSIQELAAHQFPYLPVRWLLLDKFESWKYAARVDAPTLVIAAER